MNLQEEIAKLSAEVEQLSATTQEEVENLRIKYLSKKGQVMALFEAFRAVPKEEKAQLGQALNLLRQKAETRINTLRQAMADAVASAVVREDLTRTPDPIAMGTRHPLSRVDREIGNLLIRCHSPAERR